MLECTLIATALFASIDSAGDQLVNLTAADRIRRTGAGDDAALVVYTATRRVELPLDGEAAAMTVAGILRACERQSRIGAD